MNNLFVTQDITLSSGQKSDFKIECDVLTDADIETLARLIGQKYEFNVAIGIPTGGTRLAHALQKYSDKSSKTVLLVDDVLTTGMSMERMRLELGLQGVKYLTAIVIFARGKCPDWITPMFQMWE
jgi:orotate phosphoribosyltransferase